MPKKAKLKSLPDYYKYSPGLSKMGGTNIDDQRAVASYFIKIAFHNYQKTDNLLFIWEAYNYARKVDLPIPKWVKEYIDQIAERVLTVKEYTPEAVEFMMGFRKTPDGPGTGGGASLIKQHERYLLKESAVIDVIWGKKYPPIKTLTIFAT